MDDKAFVTLLVVPILVFFSCGWFIALAWGDQPTSQPSESNATASAQQGRTSSAPATTRPSDGPSDLDKVREQRVLQFVRRYLPEEFDRLEQLRQAGDEDEYRRALDSKWRLMRQVRKSNPAVRQEHIRRYRAYRRKWRILEALRTAQDPVERKQLESQLREAIADYLDADLAIDADAVDKFEQRVLARIRQLREQIERRIHNRDKLIDQAVKKELEALARREQMARKRCSAQAGPASQPARPAGR